MGEVIEFPSESRRCRAMLERWLDEELSSRPDLIPQVSAQLLPIFDEYVAGVFSTRIPDEYRKEVSELVEQFTERAFGLFLEIAKRIVAEMCSVVRPAGGI